MQPEQVKFTYSRKPLKIDGGKITFLLEWAMFRDEVSASVRVPFSSFGNMYFEYNLVGRKCIFVSE